MQLGPFGPAATVAEVKALIAARTGAAAGDQRLVAHGRVLLDEEDLAAAGLASGGRVFLALAPPPATAGGAAVPEPPGDDAAQRAEADGASSDDVDSDSGGCGFEVIARAVGVEGEVCVPAHPGMSLAELKEKVVAQLPDPGGAPGGGPTNFVCDGRLLGDSGCLADCGVCDGARIVVVYPAAAARRGRTWLAAPRPLACLRRARAGSAHALSFAFALPGATLRWLLGVWRDPWSLARPPERGEGQGRGRRIHGFRFHPRALRYGPGQNPHGEDLTVLFSQGLLGGSAG